MKRMSLAAIAAVFALAAGSAQAQTVSIGTSPVGSSNYALGNALGKVMTEQLGLKIRVVPFGGGQQILPLINSKQLEMALPSSTDAYFAFNGNGGPFKTPNKKLRVIATVFPYYLSWYVHKNSQYKTLADLKGKKIATGFTANSAQHTTYLAGLAAFGVKPSDFEDVPVPHVVRGAADFMQGKVEASTFAIGAGKMSEVDAKVGGIRWLSMPGDKAAEQRVKAIMPAAFIGKLEPAKPLIGIVGPTNVIFHDYLVMGGAQMSDDTAYKIAKMLYEQQAKLVAISKIYGRYHKQDLARDHGVPFHPGAIKFYKEVGIWKR